MDTRTGSFSVSVTRPGGGAGFSFAANNNKTTFLNSVIPFQIENNLDWGWGAGGVTLFLLHKNKVIQFDGVGQIIIEFLPPPSALKMRKRLRQTCCRRPSEEKTLRHKYVKNSRRVSSFLTVPFGSSEHQTSHGSNAAGAVWGRLRFQALACTCMNFSDLVNLFWNTSCGLLMSHNPRTESGKIFLGK